MVTFSFSICSLVFMLIFLIIYFSKKRIKNKDNSIYSFLIITNTVGLIIDIIGYITMHTISLTSPVNIIILLGYIFLLSIFYIFPRLQIIIFSLIYPNLNIYAI